MHSSIMVVTLKFLIWSEKSLQVQLDYSLIINHIQMHENKFCLHICDHLKWEKWGRSVQPCDLGEVCICITFSLNKQQSDEQWHVLPSFFIQIIFRSEHFILLIMFLTGKVINLTGYVHFRNKLLSTSLSTVNLSYHKSNRGTFCFTTYRFVESSQTWNSFFVQ